MAAKNEQLGSDLSSFNGLMCPLCLDVFDAATLLTACGHTFCRVCLKQYDNQDLNHMICPVCRKVTKMSANRVDDLLANVTVNRLVDDFRAKSGLMTDAKDSTRRYPKCTACKLKQRAVQFCRTCDHFMCAICFESHKKLSSMFEGHKVVGIADIIQGKARGADLPCEKCQAHRGERKGSFCENCKVCVCPKCVRIDHRDHRIKSREAFEKELLYRVTGLKERCKVKESEIKETMETAERSRTEIHATLNKLRKDVSQAHIAMALQLQESHRVLLEKIDGFEYSFDEKLSFLKSIHQQELTSIMSTATLVDPVDGEKRSRIEADSLVAHTLLCDELECMLNEVTDHTSATAIIKEANRLVFRPAGHTALELGDILMSRPEHQLDCPSDEVEAAAIGAVKEGSYEANIKPKSKTGDDTGSISWSGQGREPRFTDDATNPSNSPGKPERKHIAPIKKKGSNATRASSRIHLKLWVAWRIELDEIFVNMTRRTDSSVAMTYRHVNNIISHSVTGDQLQHNWLPNGMKCYGLVFLSDGTLCVSTSERKVHIYANGKRKVTIVVPDAESELQLSRSPSDEILIANDGSQVYIYDSTGTLKRTVKTRHTLTRHVCATKSGNLVVGACTYQLRKQPNLVTVYDRDGNAGKSIEAPPGVYLYPTVDQEDRIFIAGVHRRRGAVNITLYDLDGLNLRERARFRSLTDLEVDHECRCSLVSLSPTRLAFTYSGVRGDRLYFFNVQT